MDTGTDADLGLSVSGSPNVCRETGDLFGESSHRRFTVDTLPISVVELGKTRTTHRDKGKQDEKSSRDEYSGFPCEIGTLCYQLYLKHCELVFDPFAGWGERGRLAQEHGFKYVGYDSNPEAIEVARARFGVDNTVEDSRIAFIPCFDGLITCPPYWNLESYSSEGLDAIERWDDFLIGYECVLSRCYDAAKTGAMFCIYVGDWRQFGIYYDLTFRTQRIMDECGATPIDIVVGSRATVTKIKVMIPQALANGYTVKVHETLLVFQKR